MVSLDIDIQQFEFKTIDIYILTCFNLDMSVYVVCVLKIPLRKVLY